MIKKVLIAILALVVVLGVGLYYWAQAIFSSDAVKTAVERQLTTSLGQPVRIGHISAAVFPRVTMTLENVRIGDPARITAASLDVGTDLRALLSRRIEHGTVRLMSPRVELPLPAFAFPTASRPSSTSTGSSRLPIELVSIDDVIFSDVTIVSGGRTLRGDIDIAPSGAGVVIRRVALHADGTAMNITGRIDDLAGPTGELAITGGALNIADLLGFLTDFSNGAGMTTTVKSGSASPPPATAVPMRLSVTLEVERAHFGTLVLEKVGGRAVIMPSEVTIDPVRFGIFGGAYQGTLTFALGNASDFHLDASLSGVDMASAMRFAGTPDAVTGRLAGRVDVSGRGFSAQEVLSSLRGTSRIDLTNGTVKSLGLVRAVVLASSMRTDSQVQAAKAKADEPFSRLGATLAIGNGSATTTDLRFESSDVLMSGTGAVRLDGSDVKLVARLQLSEALTARAGRDLVRYTQENGRVTLPATVSGDAGRLHVGVDMASVAKRAITNRANEETKKAISKGLGGLIRR